MPCKKGKDVCVSVHHNPISKVFDYIKYLSTSNFRMVFFAGGSVSKASSVKENLNSVVNWGLFL